jgi:hypothetical protein
MPENVVHTVIMKEFKKMALQKSSISGHQESKKRHVGMKLLIINLVVLCGHSYICI